MKKNPEVKIFGRCRAGLLVVLAGVCILPTRSSGLALYNDTLALPGNLNNNVVMVAETYGATTATTTLKAGTGTVISVVPDGAGGDWYNVLTADHVVYGAVNSVADGNLGAIGIAWPTGTPLIVNSVVNNVQLDGGNGPDLAVIGIDVTAAQLAADNNPVPGTNGANTLAKSVTLAAPNDAAGNQIVQVGFGSQATIGTAPSPPNPAGTPCYLATQDFGTYNSGGNTISMLLSDFALTPNPRGGKYVFDAVEGTCDFTGAAGSVTKGTTYILSGDSGGPTFQNINGTMDLIGVHSYADGNNIGTPNEYETSGQLWDDVQVSSYISWINGATNAVDVPEPSTSALAGVGGLLWLLRCGRRVATLKRLTHF